jgi:poly-gamma-glutamate capsule biosynthesis protein CapA/YwtB (metallophosphatase superfamily)
MLRPRAAPSTLPAVGGGQRIRRVRVVLAALGVAVLTGGSPTPAGHQAATASTGATSATTPTPAAPASLTVVATGDVLIHQDGHLVAGAAAAGQAHGTDYDFSGVFAPLAPIISAADLAICHLETPLAPPGGPFSGYPTFDVQPQIADALAGAGYDDCSTASNHSMDAGFPGLVRTLNTLDAASIGHSGTYRTAAEAQPPHILTVHGVKVADLAFTYGLNGIPEPGDKPWAVDDFDPIGPQVAGMLAAAHAARAAGAQIVIASVHCCTEYTSDPTAAQVAIASKLLASPDVDLVVGHHAHVVQPFERIGGKWVAYGLGNEIAEQTLPGTRDSVIARFTFTRGADGSYSVRTAEAIPTAIQPAGDGLAVVPTRPGDPAYQRVAEVVNRRGAADAGLLLTTG